LTSNNPIYVTQPFLPPLEEFIPYLEKIWNSKVVTNNGKFHRELEEELCKYLGVRYVSLFSNGTLGLIVALQALGIKGDVITTPYSFVATAHSMLWHGNKPIFVDIKADTCNLDPSKIEAAITPETTAIMPVHCYGNPCDVEAIKAIADRHNLKIIYDAAHAFGVQCHCGSILNHGDLSVLSFHATKVFNTLEGGAVISHDSETKEKIDRLKNFGFVDEITVSASGMNAKMNELNAAFGLLHLKYIDEIINHRSNLDKFYRILLRDLDGIECLKNTAFKSNYSYFPILVKSNYALTRDELYQKLKKYNIFARRYFYPLITEFPMYKIFSTSDGANLPVAKLVANQILCLPMFVDLKLKDIERIVKIIREV
jgi:dTDP-4-amino-4,6-dideoxygalactose transaminase